MGLEEKLSEILNNPESMAQILSMAKSLGMEPDQAEKTAPESPPAADPEMLQGLMRLMKQVQYRDGKQEALLQALKPYLAPERRDKIDQALQIARISHLAGAALGNYGGIFGKQGG